MLIGWSGASWSGIKSAEKLKKSSTCINYANKGPGTYHLKASIDMSIPPTTHDLKLQYNQT